MKPSNIEISQTVLQKEIAYTGTPEENIAHLQEVFQGSPDNLFVRGSFVRGDVPYDDIDVSAYNPNGNYKGENYPSAFMGIPIVYGGMPLEHLEDYFETCLRGASSLMETVALVSPDPAASQIIERQQDTFIQEKLPDYLLFLQIEEEISGRRYDGNRSAAYYDRKRERGSKRSISRMIWTIKSLYPELYGIKNTRAAMQEAKKRKLFSDEVIDDSNRIFELLSRDFIDPREWDERTHRLNSWIQGVLNPTAKKYASFHLPADYVARIDTALRENATKGELESALEYADNESIKY